MFKDINIYINESNDLRKKHLDLSEDCIEIGTISTNCRALLAHHLGTTVPMGQSINLCHAYHNSKCSNIKHLYWGTASENVKDAYDNGQLKIPPHQHLVAKYGEKGAKEICSERAKKTRFWENGCGHNKLNNTQIQEFRNLVKDSEPEKFGWIARVANKLNISHTQIRRHATKYCKDINLYKRK
jgi:hypothetical protein